MKLYVLFGQRKERYTGEYGPEALECMSEYDNEVNSDYLPSKLSVHEKSHDFESLEIITLEVNEEDIMKILRPQHQPVNAKIIN